MVAVAPGAVYKQLPINFTREHWDYSLGLILHVQAGNGELYGWFSNPGAQASSHWWVAKNGALYQYLDPDEHQSWAQGNGNSEYHSVETEGYPGEPLTPAQITTLGRLYAWGRQKYGWPLQLAEAPGQKGLGWHGMGGAAWGGHNGCPGNLRKPQRNAILAAASGTDTQKETANVWEYKLANKTTNPSSVTAAETLWGTNYAAWETKKQVDLLSAQVSRMAADLAAIKTKLGA